MNGYTFRGSNFAFFIFSNLKLDFIWASIGQSNKCFLNGHGDVTKRVATPLYNEFLFCRNSLLVCQLQWWYPIRLHAIYSLRFS